MANVWFRLYHEFADDPKVQMLPEAMQRRFIMLLCSKCKGETLQETQMAFHWRITLADLAETKAIFIENGFIEEDWSLCNWNKRQFLSDSSTDRVRRFRQGKKQDETLHETVSPVTVTPPDTEQIQKQIQKHKQPTSPATQPTAIEKHPDLLIYECYPRKEAKGDAMKAIAKAVKKIAKGEHPLEPCDTLQARRLLYARVLAYARSPAGQNPDKTRIPHPATWFNGSRYLDDQANWQHVNGASNGHQTKADRDAAVWDKILKDAGAEEDSEELRFAEAVDAGPRGGEFVRIGSRELPHSGR